eukprot:11894777-Heterocapsa_arctica.AAC.1
MTLAIPREQAQREGHNTRGRARTGSGQRGRNGLNTQAGDRSSGARMTSRGRPKGAAGKAGPHRAGALW